MIIEILLLEVMKTKEIIFLPLITKKNLSTLIQIIYMKQKL